MVAFALVFEVYLSQSCNFLKHEAPFNEYDENFDISLKVKLVAKTSNTEGIIGNFHIFFFIVKKYFH